MYILQHLSMVSAATYFPAEQLGEEHPLSKLQPLHCASYTWGDPWPSRKGKILSSHYVKG